MSRLILPGAMMGLLLLACICGLKPAYGLQDSVPPEWRNQQQGASTIPQGSYVSLQAEGKDTDSLNYAFLSTNETGNWMNVTENNELWRNEAVWGFDNFGTATYKDGVLYAPSKGAEYVCAVDATNGGEIWFTPVRECDASPCVDGDAVYVGECMRPGGEPTPYPKAMALNRFTGGEIWHYVEPSNCGWVGSPLVNGDYVYYTTYGAGVYALNKTDGNPIWHRPDIGAIVCSVAYDNGVVFVSAYNPAGQYALNATTGAEMWHRNYGGSWDSSPVVYNGKVIQVTFSADRSVWSANVLSEADGQLIRRFEGKGSPSTPLVCDDRIFIPSRDWKMWAYDLLTGEEVWHTVDLHDGRLQNYSYCSPAASGGGIYYQSLNGTFYVIDQTDGDVLWSFALGDLGFGSPSIGDGNVYITNDYALYAFRIGPGSGDWPMFCQNKVHQSVSEQGVEYMRWPVAGVQYFKVSNEWVTARFLWCNATIVSASIAWRVYFVDSYGNENVTDVMVFYVRPVVHDVAVAAVAVSKTVVGCGFTLSIQATVRNVGETEESFSVKAYANGTLVGVQTVTELHCNGSTNVTFVWNSSGFAYGNYTISTVADTVLGENNTGDNTCFANDPVHVGVPGDVTSTIEGVYDGRVDLRDVTYLILLFQTRPDSPNWKPNADVNDDGIMNIKDITIAILHFYQQE